MKKVLLVASIASALSLVNVAQAATGGTIDFNGKISDQTCEVTVNGTGTGNGTVNMGTSPAGELTALNDEAGDTNFTLNLTGCTAKATTFGVTAYFPDNAANIDSTTATLKNKATTGAATNVGLALYNVINGTENAVPLGKNVTDAGYKFTTVAIGDTSAVMNYRVKYKNVTGTAATAGVVTGQAVYELSYE